MLPLLEVMEEICGKGTTTMLNDLVSLSGGAPLSVARTVTELVSRAVV